MRRNFLICGRKVGHVFPAGRIQKLAGTPTEIVAGRIEIVAGRHEVLTGRMASRSLVGRIDSLAGRECGVWPAGWKAWWARIETGPAEMFLSSASQRVPNTGIAYMGLCCTRFRFD
jgi:hypothetical protein